MHVSRSTRATSLFSPQTLRPARQTSRHVICHASQFFDKKVIVIGGTGAVGRCAIRGMQQWEGVPSITVSGRSKGKYEELKGTYECYRDTSFAECNVDDVESVKAAIAGHDLVIHTAGPFQCGKECTVLEAAIEQGVGYMDVCDDTEYSQKAAAFADAAKTAGVPAITTTGIYPGLSNVVAAYMVASMRDQIETDPDKVREAGTVWREEPGPTAKTVSSVQYAYFTAGTGGISDTILETALYMYGQNTSSYKDWNLVQKEPFYQTRSTDFGDDIGTQLVASCDLPEVHSTRYVLKVPNVLAAFGTAPFFYTLLSPLLIKIYKQESFRNPEFVKDMVKKLAPAVKFTETFWGQSVAIRIEVLSTDGRKKGSLYQADSLTQGIGDCIASFAHCVLSGETKPGVWFPENLEAVEDRGRFILDATKSAKRFILNKAAFQLDGEPREIVFGFYR